MKCLRCNKKKIIFDVSDAKLYMCERCGTKYSRLFDYDSGFWKYVEGNFIVPGDLIIVIFSGTDEEFEEARNKISKISGLDKSRIINLTEDNVMLVADKRTLLYVTGTYYEKDYLLMNPNVIHLINSRRMV